MSIFSRKRREEVPHWGWFDAYGNDLLEATDGIHGTDGESMDAGDGFAGNTDDTHGTDGEDFGDGKPREKKRRKGDPLKADGVPKWTESHGERMLNAERNDSEFANDLTVVGGKAAGVADSDIVANDMAVSDAIPSDNVAWDDEEYLTDGLRGSEEKGERNLLKRLLFRSGARRERRRGANPLALLFARLFGRRLPRETALQPMRALMPSRNNAAQTSDKAINEALERWREAERYFQMLPHDDLIDYAAYNVEAARKRYIFLLNMERRQSDIAKEMGLSEDFESKRLKKKPMGEHMMRIPEDVLPQ